MHRLLIFLAAVSGGALLLYGLVQPIEAEGRWLQLLWLGSLLVGIAVVAARPARARGLPRSVQNLATFLMLGFVLLSVQLLRQQFVQRDALYSYARINPQTGQVTSNARQVFDGLRVQRGAIRDRTGIPLVVSEVLDRGLTRRVYPLAERWNPAAFSHVIGYFSPRFGADGLEASFDAELTGDTDQVERLRDLVSGRAQRGNDLVLTIDGELQARVAALLGDRPGAVVVLDPRSGAVLAMVSTPGYDPARLTYDPDAPDPEAAAAAVDAYWRELNSDASGVALLNRATLGLYPPGSTFKSVTAVGVLMNPREGNPGQITCPNEFFTGEAGAPPVVNAVENLGRDFTGDPSVLERVFAYSCNTAFAQFGLRLGPETFSEQARRFGFVPAAEAPEQYPGFQDLPTNTSRLFSTPDFLLRPSALADTAYGQGQLQVTPLQMALVAAAIANDGVMMRPYLVHQVVRPGGAVLWEHRNQVLERNVMTPEVAATMRQYLRAGVTYGFGRPADVTGLSVGGKSGTAEIGDGSGQTHAWFIAIAPSEQPRFALAVVLERGGSGAGPAAELAGQVLAAAFDTMQ